MTKLKELSLSIPEFYATAPYPCSYLPDQIARSQVATPHHLINADNYSRLLEQGFRRSGLFTYRPYCDHCQACIPVRIDIARFHPSRSQRRAWRRHAQLSTLVAPLGYHSEHYALYLAYQAERHKGGGMDEDNQQQYIEFLLQSQINSRLVEFRGPAENHQAGKLRIVSMLDLSHHGLSSVYTFYDTSNPKDSLGIYSILWQIEQARKLNLAYLYLGYWIQANKKMAYKRNFQGIQGFIESRWQYL